LTPIVGSAATGFCYLGGILQLFHRQDQQILRLPTASARSFQQNSPSTSTIIYSIKIFNASPSRIVEFVQIGGSPDNFSRQASSWLLQHTTSHLSTPKKYLGDQEQSTRPRSLGHTSDHRVTAAQKFNLQEYGLVLSTVFVSAAQDDPSNHLQEVQQNVSVYSNKKIHQDQQQAAAISAETGLGFVVT
jgi:hypothetical protein